MSRLSIITVVLNGENTIGITLSSILNQKYDSFEYIIVDGGSSDNTIKIIADFQKVLEKKGSNISLKFLSESDSGIYDGMNKGVKMSTGEYCLFLNSGDFLVNSSTIEKLFSQDYEEDIIYSNVVTIKNGRFDIYRFPKNLTLFFWYYWSLNHQNTLIKRSLFDKIGLYNTELKIASDYEFFIKSIIIENCKIRHIDIVICCYDMKGISSNLALLQNERMKVLRTIFSDRILNDYNLLYKLEKPRIKIFLTRVCRKVTSIFRHLYIKHYIYEQ